MRDRFQKNIKKSKSEVFPKHFINFWTIFLCYFSIYRIAIYFVGGGKFVPYVIGIWEFDIQLFLFEVIGSIQPGHWVEQLWPVNFETWKCNRRMLNSFHSLATNLFQRSLFLHVTFFQNYIGTSLLYTVKRLLLNRVIAIKPPRPRYYYYL